MPYGETRSGSLLTPGEQAVLEGLADGLRSTEIAKNLNASVKTFYAVCERLREKLGARTDVHAVSIGFRRGLLQLERRKSRRTEDTPS
jgi:DNA-binding CsgD family transcriptional regulator